MPTYYTPFHLNGVPYEVPSDMSTPELGFDLHLVYGQCYKSAAASASMSCVIELNGGTHPVVQMIKVVPNSTIELLPLRLPNPDPIIQGSGEAVGLAWVGAGATLTMTRITVMGFGGGAIHAEASRDASAGAGGSRSKRARGAGAEYGESALCFASRLLNASDISRHSGRSPSRDFQDGARLLTDVTMRQTRD